ncbi:hypothetical protein DPMN_084051 [Dreissena polymorpha]|uniref:Uncharacterized protein n=1 Tax=Dreissena polymorpha TaxID=45954 RepID=A0A9D3YAE5_DREPO|nr:hypothetical protein DPMN_084051 [Dreissena polymorpha]
MHKMCIRECTIVMRRALVTCTIGVDNIERFKIIAASWRVRATKEYNTATYNDEWADSHDTMQVLARYIDSTSRSSEIRQTDDRTDGGTNGRTGGTDGQTDRKTDRKTDRQTDFLFQTCT